MNIINNEMSVENWTYLDMKYRIYDLCQRWRGKEMDTRGEEGVLHAGKHWLCHFMEMKCHFKDR